jgi:hypothetical protein
MTSWGYLILVVAVFLGLHTAIQPKHRYVAMCVVVFVALSYAAVHQHTY